MDNDKTSDQSNSDELENPTSDGVVEDQQLDSEADAGQAADDDASDSKANEDSEGEHKSRGEVRHERYIDKLAEEIRQSNANATRYTEELFTPKPYQPIQYQEGDYDPKQLEDDRNTVANNRFAEGVQTGINQGTSQVVKELWADRFDIDSERVTTKWDALNPERDTYNPKLESSLVQKYIQFAGVEKDNKGRVTIQKPNIRFKDFVQAEMQNLEDYAATRNANSTKNVVKQAASTGVRPGGQARTSKPTWDFSDPHALEKMSSEDYWKNGGKEASDAYLAERLGIK